MQAAIRNYRNLLKTMKLSPEQIEAKVREAIGS